MTGARQELLVLHAVRVLGFAGTARVAVRSGTDETEARSVLDRAHAAGLATWSAFGGDGGWSLTEAGRVHGERLLARELDATGSRDVVREVLDGFGPLNDLVAGACTRWQLTEMGLARPPADLADVLTDLMRAADGLRELEARLARDLARFAGYHDRFAHAVRRAGDDQAWIAGTDRDSAHRVWFELHEDLLATLGRAR